MVNSYNSKMGNTDSSRTRSIAPPVSYPPSPILHSSREGSPDYSIRRRTSSTCSTVISTTDDERPPEPSRPPTKDEIIRNYENLCDSNPDIDQLINMYGYFRLQYSPTDSTFTERSNEINKISRTASMFYRTKKFGVSLSSITGNVFIWDNHVAIAYKDNIRILGFFDRDIRHS